MNIYTVQRGADVLAAFSILYSAEDFIVRSKPAHGFESPAVIEPFQDERGRGWRYFGFVIREMHMEVRNG